MNGRAAIVTGFKWAETVVSLADADEVVELSALIVMDCFLRQG
jgi:hypothetical protein